MRLLTLACFFHFSGLNNGITCMVMASGRMQSASVAPALARDAARMFNPSAVRRAWSRASWFHWAQGSKRVIELSSHQAVQRIFQAGIMVQFVQNLQTTAPSAAEHVAQSLAVEFPQGRAEAVALETVGLPQSAVWLKTETWNLPGSRQLEIRNRPERFAKINLTRDTRSAPALKQQAWRRSIPPGGLSMNAGALYSMNGDTDDPAPSLLRSPRVHLKSSLRSGVIFFFLGAA